MEWYYYLVVFIGFWLLRVIYYFIKVRHVNKYNKIYSDWTKGNESELFIGKHIYAIRKIFKDAGVKNFILSRMKTDALGYVTPYNLEGFSNIHLNDRELINKILFKFEETRGNYTCKMKQSFSPIYWLEFTLKLPEQIFSYLNFNIADSVMKIIQLFYWIAGIILGLHAAKIIDIHTWF